MSLLAFYKKLRRVYTARYLLLNLVILLIYYVAVQRIEAIQQFGIIFSVAPAYLVVALVASSSVLMTIAVYTILQSKKGKAFGYGEAASSCATSLVGAIMSGCGCQGAILYSALALVAGSGEAFAINTVFAEHIGLVLGALTILNIAFVVYSLSRLPGGGANGRKGR